MLTLLVFLFAITPHEFIHNEIAHHIDTVDGPHKHAGVSDRHIHCKFLQEVIAPYLAGKTKIIQPVHISHYTFIENTISFAPVKDLFHSYLRGPPACI